MLMPTSRLGARRVLATISCVLLSTCATVAKLRRNKIQCSHKRFSAKALCKETYGYYLNAKGYNPRVLSEWLQDCLTEVNNNPQLVAGLVADERAAMAEKTLQLASKKELKIGLLCQGWPSTATTG